METPSWFEPFKKMIEQLFNKIFGVVSEAKKDFNPISRTPLLGDRGEHVRILQEALNEKNNAGLVADGIFGPLTRKAVSEFQKKKGLNGSGVIGPKTLELLELEVAASSNTGDLRERIWKTAYAELGVREIPGPQHNPRILEYHATTGGFGDDETAWCSSFVEWCLRQNGQRGTGSAAARSWMNYGVQTTHPKRGDIVVFWRVARNSWQGHVAFYSHETATHIHVLGGNQSNSVNIQAYSKNQLLGYRTYV